MSDDYNELKDTESEMERLDKEIDQQLKNNNEAAAWKAQQELNKIHKNWWYLLRKFLKSENIKKT